MPIKEKTERNQLIARLYKKNEHGYKKLGKQFNLSYWTVRDIVEREKLRGLGKSRKK